MIFSSSLALIVATIKFTLIIYSMNKTHTINNLIMLEFAVMSTSLFMFMNLVNMNNELYLMFFFLILMITESILGLSILILMIRTHSNDYLKSASVMIL
uniref:NADH dehydrogenase subunit 4L n=1 Tax=Aleurocanthus spiniferus TaxID=593793 RepID=A0A0X8VM54_ALESP|nr:NADH dehydrogenase subunit 4L [Aleurocanthus spiniferus]AHY04221.1 NADH dehydrogenase subunit 4L [Aleurocanthus spiniferus]